MRSSCDVYPSGGVSDDFDQNDSKVFKFQVLGLQLRLFLPLVVRGSPAEGGQLVPQAGVIISPAPVPAGRSL